jgi:hypothetical protein
MKTPQSRVGESCGERSVEFETRALQALHETRQDETSERKKPGDVCLHRPNGRAQGKNYSHIRKENGTTITISKIEMNSEKINLKNTLGI